MRATILSLFALSTSAFSQAELVHLANEGFLIRSEAHTVLIDAWVGKPYVGYPALTAEALERMQAAEAPFDAVDLALVSHIHRDHFQPELAATFLAASPDTQVFSSDQAATFLTDAGVDASRITGQDLEEGEQLEAEPAGVPVFCFRLSHGQRFPGVQNIGHVIEVGGVRFLHLGDAVPDPVAFAALDLPARNIDVALVPYWYLDGGPGQKLIEEQIAARHVVAMHVPFPQLAPLRKRLVDSGVSVMDRGEVQRYAPQARFTVEHEVVPVLTNRDLNPVARLRVRGPVTITGLRLACSESFSRFALAYSDERRVDPEQVELLRGYREEQGAPAGERAFSWDPIEVPEGEHSLWLLAGVAADLDLTSKLPLEVRALETQAGTLEPAGVEATVLRPGVRVRHRGDDGSLGYRIPALVRTNAGSLVAAYDVRRDGQRDLQGDIDIGISRSTDGGATWGPMRVGLDLGTWGELPEKFNGVSDACLLVDRETGRLFVFGCWMYGVRTEEGALEEDLTEDSQLWSHQWRLGKRGSGPGLTPEETAQFVMATSDDDGVTWSEPINLTEQVKDPAWYLAAPAPGNGITLQDGTLAIPAGGRDADQNTFSSVMISEDRGVTWRYVDTPAGHDTTEAALVELGGGTWMLNMRDNRNRRDRGDTNGRAVAVSKDRGATWASHPSDHRADLLPEPVCMASLIRLEDGTLVFANPAHRSERRRLTLKASTDEGLTWPSEQHVLLDEVFGGYSCLAPAGAGAVGVLYESSQGYLVFQKVTLDDLGIAQAGPRDLSPLLEPLLEEHGVPALACLQMQDGQITGSGVAGVRKSGGEVPAGPDDLWHLGSCTRAMTATLAARLVDAGVVRWDWTCGSSGSAGAGRSRTCTCSSSPRATVSPWSWSCATSSATPSASRRRARSWRCASRGAATTSRSPWDGAGPGVPEEDR